MTQDERWLVKWREYMDFLATNKHRPSKYKVEEHDLVNWMKHNRRLYTHNKMPANRLKAFRHLLTVCEHFQRVNQYAYKETWYGDYLTDDTEV